MKNNVNVADCEKQAFCTGCPSRKGCGIRKSFYHKQDYEKERKKTNIAVIAELIMMGGWDTDTIIVECDKVLNAIDRKRERELKEHPTYSYE